MFCYQCQETAKGKGCTKMGVCGKNPVVSVLQDLLVYTVKGLSEIVIEENIDIDSIMDINREVVKSLFMTITNANFDDKSIELQIKKMIEYRDLLKRNKSMSDASNFIVNNREERGH